MRNMREGQRGPSRRRYRLFDCVVGVERFFQGRLWGWTTSSTRTWRRISSTRSFVVMRKSSELLIQHRNHKVHHFLDVPSSERMYEFREERRRDCREGSIAARGGRNKHEFSSEQFYHGGEASLIPEGEASLIPVDPSARRGLRLSHSRGPVPIACLAFLNFIPFLFEVFERISTPLGPVLV